MREINYIFFMALSTIQHPESEYTGFLLYTVDVVLLNKYCNKLPFNYTN
jgi:hypothetical protein